MKFEENAGLRNRTTYRIGGAARWYAEPSTENEITDALRFATDKGLPLFALGKGSNVLFSDKGWPGLVINLSPFFTRIEWNETEAVCRSGALLNTLACDSVRKGLSGMEELSGIPGTIGGAVIMNAGAFKSSTSDTLTEVTYYDLEQNVCATVPARGLALGYRSSALQHLRTIILSARFTFKNDKRPERLAEVREDVLIRRKEKQPLDYPNCGSVFKRPPGGFAGQLIEQCGLKGFRRGDAEVSAKHANFIINHGKATAEDVRKVIYSVQEAVYGRFGVLLETEVLFIGEFEQPLFIPEENGRGVK